MPSKWENASWKYVKMRACHAQISNYNATLASKLLSYQDISKNNSNCFGIFLSKGP